MVANELGAPLDGKLISSRIQRIGFTPSAKALKKRCPKWPWSWS